MDSSPADEAANNVKVCIRVRPLQPHEQGNGDDVACAALSDDRTVRISVPTDNRRRIETQMIQFDHVFSPQTKQIDVFHRSGCEMFCDKAIDGFASTVFCFGQTGSGKTYTMSGPPDVGPDSPHESLGLQFRSAHYICSAVDAIRREEGGDAVVMKASYIEIYNEQVNDLLNETTNLKVRWSQKAQSFFIEELMIVTCDGIEDVLAVLSEGANNRKRAAHKLNVDSSRSHVIFTMYFERRNHEDRKLPLRFGKINFVDLAGSEKLRDSESTGVNAVETKSINKSLFSLGNVIQCLSSGSATFIPYRDSTLTKLLMDSLGGNCATLMISCVTPSSRFADESMRTIKYAARTSSITNSIPVVRVDPQHQKVFEIQMELDLLRKENSELRARLERYEGGESTIGSQADPRAQPPVPTRSPAKAQHYDEPQSQPPPTWTPPPAPLPAAESAIDPPGHGNNDVASRIHDDNRRLRDEVAQLRNLVLETRERESSTGRPPAGPNKPLLGPISSAPPTIPDDDARYVKSVPSSVPSSIPSTANSQTKPESSNDLLGFGFRPAPKRASRLNLMPISEASSTVNSVSSAPQPSTRPMFDGGSAGHPPGSSNEIVRMQRELSSAQDELRALREDRQRYQ